jgi:hypothetical protein
MTSPLFYCPRPILSEDPEVICREAFAYGTIDKVLVCSERDRAFISGAFDGVRLSYGFKLLIIGTGLPDGSALFLDREVWDGIHK